MPRVRDAKHHLDEAQVLKEIAYFEARLAAMGHSGDCAYEKSLARTYDCLLRERRRMLTALRRGRPPRQCWEAGFES
jgi:hypothetical protein